MRLYKEAVEGIARMVGGAASRLESSTTRAGEGTASGMDAYASQLMPHAWYFEVPALAIDNLQLTNNEPRGDTRLPFPACWVEAEFHYRSKRPKIDRKYLGLFIYEYWTDGVGGPTIMHPNGSLAVEPPSDAHRIGLNFLAYYEDPADYDRGVQPTGIVHGTVGYDDDEIVVEGDEVASSPKFESEFHFLSSMVMNFVDLLDTPQVKVSKQVRSQRNLQRGEERYGVKPPSTIVRVRLGKELTDALEANASGISSNKYSHAFWVRGHWRHLSSPKWKEQQGKRIWISPYVKGKDTGILVKKTYEVEDG